MFGVCCRAAQAEETGPGSGVCVEEFGPRWGREKLLGLWDPLAVGPSHPPISALRALRKGLSLGVLFVPTVCCRAPGGDSNATEDPLSQLPASAVCHPSQKWAGREERMSPPVRAPEAGGREENANVCDSVHRFPRTFRDEGGPCLLPVQKWWGG